MNSIEDNWLLSTSSAPAEEDLSSKFKWPEYVVFIAVLLISAGIGVFYAIFGKSKEPGNASTEFLLAGKSMSVFPMAMSLVASFLSAIALLGEPAEIYTFGTMYFLVTGSFLVVFVSAAYVYLPVFANLQVTSAYEYLERRFAYRVRIVGGLTFTFQMCVYMAMVVYAPAIALSQVTGINHYYAVSGVFLVCIFYTSIGGLKAVMWTDTFQIIVMFISMTCIIVKSYIDVGGAAKIWEIAEEGGRIQWWNASFDMRERHTIWGVTIGYYFMWIAIYGVNQSQVQRYLSVPSVSHARWALFINGIGISVMLVVTCAMGLIMYAKYHDCDPLAAGTVESSDQILPLLVMESLSDIPGLPGLFVAGVFSGGLSSVSSGLNSIAAIATEDVVRKRWPHISDERLTNISKILATAFGLLCFGIVFIVERLGTGVLNVSLSMFGIIGGPLHGVFALGMFFPWTNKHGAFIGLLSGLTFTMWLGFGTQVAIVNGDLVLPKLPVSVEGCPGNLTLPEVPAGTTGGLVEFYRISYIWYSMLGFSVVVIVGLIISFLTGPQDPRKLDPALVSPPINKLVSWVLPKSFLKKIGWEIGSMYNVKEDLDKYS